MEDVSLFDSSSAIKSLRNSDFDANSAYGEVVDNSIQAKANEVRIQFSYEEEEGQEIIRAVTFADNGIGMSKEVIHKCLQLGYSTRFDNRDEIGRFGVGATLAAINQCEKVEIYSKEKGKDWFYTYIDIKEITSTPANMKGIPEPKQKNPSDIYSNVLEKDQEQGTLVIWSQYDRQDGKATDIMNEFKIWAGRTYRKFIWDKNLKIFVNDGLVYAIDPLYVRTEKTKFPEDPKGQEIDKMNIEWPIPKIDSPNDKTGVSTISIRMSILPEEFRKEQGSGGSPEAKERYIDRNEGISILRNDREVFYGRIPYWKPRLREIDRWWGCEISFNARLDHEFSIKNIKNGAIPKKLLKDALIRKIKTTREYIVGEVSSHWKKKIAEDSLLESKPSGHEIAQSIAKNTTLPKTRIDSDKNIDEEIDKHIESSDALKDAKSRERARFKEKFKSQPFTIYEDKWKGKDFFEVIHLGGKSILVYNLNHIFFEYFFNRINQIDGERDDTTDAERDDVAKLLDFKLITDLLLISFGRAEAAFDKEETMNIESFLEQFKLEWGNFLSEYVKTTKRSN